MTYKTMQSVGLALSAFLLVASTERVDAQTRTRSNRARCSRVYVSSPEHSSARRSRTKFSAAEIMDIQLQTRVSSKLAGQHTLELKIYTPKGNLYQSMKVQFDAASEKPASKNGRTRGSRRYHEVSTLLPVAGTSIVSSSMYGKWSVEAFLDGAEEGCSRPKSFIIEP